MTEIEQNFPFETFRDGQYECIEYILNSFNQGKKYVILEAPTGAGKSAIGMTISTFYLKSYYLTIQKMLQSQIITDFEDHDKYNVVDLKGRDTYPCDIYKREGNRLVKKKSIIARETKQTTKRTNANLRVRSL